MVKHILNTRMLFVFMVLIVGTFSCKSSRKHTETNFTKGVYGDPGTLLKAGYTFSELGLNAIFVRSSSLTDELYNTAIEQGCKIYVEFPVLLGQQFLLNNSECMPIDETGKPSPPADWFMGICPTCPEFKEDRREHLKSILNQFEVDGIFLDYIHWHAQFETPEPILPETCFCERCLYLFSNSYNIDIPKGEISTISDFIFSFHEKEWREWRKNILTGWIVDLKQILKTHQPKSLLGLFYSPWYPSEYDSALYRTLGIDINDFVREADVLSPMLFHRMTDRPENWISEYTTWLDSVNRTIRPDNQPKIWPIVQAHNNPGEVSPTEFREAMLYGSAFPSSGIMMFSDGALLQDPRKIEIVKELYVVAP